VSSADEPDAADEPDREGAMPVRPRGTLSQAVAEELLVIAVFAGFALWLFWWL
jgi:hypothetical protein